MENHFFFLNLIFFTYIRVQWVQKVKGSTFSLLHLSFEKLSINKTLFLFWKIDSVDFPEYLFFQPIDRFLLCRELCDFDCYLISNI